MPNDSENNELLNDTPELEPTPEPEPEPEPRDEWDDLIDKFLMIYPEFKPFLNTGDIEKDTENKAYLKVIMRKISCLYPEFNDLETCKNSLPFLMLVAHYLAMSGRLSEYGLGGLAGSPNGLVASSSVGDVSVSYQGTPYTGGDTDEFRYWLSLTPYGKEYLAWLARQSGLMYVNNY